MILAALASVWSFSGPLERGLGVHPASWSRSPVSAMSAPAGLGRMGELQAETAWGYEDHEHSFAAAAVMPLGPEGLSAGAGGGWNGAPGTGFFQLSGCYVLTGDPIGFMEGLFGPSVTTGASAGVLTDSTGSTESYFDLGLQFSLFPSFALGVNCSDVSGSRVFSTGFSHVFNRNLLIHVNYRDETWQAGAELTVKPSFKLFSGTDGRGLNCGASLSRGEWTLSYGARLVENTIDHGAGISRGFP